MKTYWQLLAEVTQALKSRLGKVVSPLLIPREPYPWSTAHNGWWHPTKPPVKFPWGTGNYHITQVVRNPAAFDLTKAKIYEIMLPRYGNEREMVDSVYERLTLGLKDSDDPIEDYLFSKGWVRTKTLGNGNHISVNIEGVPPYIRRAVELVAVHAYAITNRGGKLALQVDDRSDHTGKWYQTPEEIERYGKGR